MEFADVLAGRRSVRSYTQRPVDELVVNRLLRAAVQAPSAMNGQPWAFAVVQNVPTLARWSDRAKTMLLASTSSDPKTHHYAEVLGDPSFNIFYDASTLIVIGVLERNAYRYADCWLAAGDLMLAARDAGLGSCCIGFALPLVNTPAVKTELGFPASGEVVAAIVVGYARNDPPPVSRSEPRVQAWLR